VHVDVYPFGSMRLPDVRRSGASVGIRDVASPIHDPEMGDWPSMGGTGSKPKRDGMEGSFLRNRECKRREGQK